MSGLGNHVVEPSDVNFSAVKVGDIVSVVTKDGQNRLFVVLKLPSAGYSSLYGHFDDETGSTHNLYAKDILLIEKASTNQIVEIMRQRNWLRARFARIEARLKDLLE